MAPATMSRSASTDLINDPDVEIVPLHQLTPELMDPLRRADRVIFIDASTTGRPRRYP